MKWNNQKIAVGKGLEKLMKTYEKIVIDKEDNIREILMKKFKQYRNNIQGLKIIEKRAYKYLKKLLKIIKKEKKKVITNVITFFYN